MSPSATSATRSEGGCRQAPCLPRKVPRRHRRLTGPKRATESSPVPQVPSATPATRSEGGCRQVPPPATQNEGRCHQVPRLPREAKVDAVKRHACHAKCRGVTGDWPRLSAPKRATESSPAPQVPRLPRKNEGRCHQAPRLPKMVWWKMVCDKVVCERWRGERWRVTKLCERWRGERWCVTKLCVKDGVVKDGVWQSCVWKMVWWKMVCDKVVWERRCVCVTKLCVKDGVVKDGVWQSCVWKMVRWKMVCDKVVCERWCVWKVVCDSGRGAGEAEEGGYRIKSKNPTIPYTKIWGKTEHKQRTKCCNLQPFALSEGKNRRKYHSVYPWKLIKHGYLQGFTHLTIFDFSETRKYQSFLHSSKQKIGSKSAKNAPSRAKNCVNTSVSASKSCQNSAIYSVWCLPGFLDILKILQIPAFFAINLPKMM